VLTEWPVPIGPGCRWSSKCDRTDEGPLGNHNEPHHTTLDFEAEEEDDEYAHCYDLQWVEYPSKSYQCQFGGRTRDLTLTC